MAKLNTNKRIEPSDILDILKIVLAQEPKPNNNWYNFYTCLSCGKSSDNSLKFGITLTHNSFYMNCFKCGFQTKTKEAYQSVYSTLGIDQDNSYSIDNYKPLAEVVAPAPKVSIENISEILTDLNNSLVQSDTHKSMFYAKRGFIMPNDYKSISGYHDIKYLYDKYNHESLDLIFKNTKGNFNNLKDRIIIFHRDFTGKIVYYRLYSFTSNKKYKKLSPKKIQSLSWTIPFRLELITPETKHLIITEGEEKTDIGNIYKQSHQTFISIPGINNFNCLYPVIEKINKNETNINQITILLDKSTKEDLKEEKASIRIIEHLQSLLNQSIQLNICELPSPDKSDKNDLDGYLKDVAPENRKEILKNILKRNFDLKEYNQIHSLSKDKRVFEKVKNEFKTLTKTKSEANSISLELSKELVRDIRQSFLDPSTELTLIDNRPAGTGKTYDNLKFINDNNINSEISLPTKKQRDNIATDNNFQINISLTDIIYKAIDTNTLFNDSEKERHKKQCNLFMSLGLVKELRIYLRSYNIEIKFPKINNNKTIVSTHAKTFNSNIENIFRDLVYLDESAIKQFITSHSCDFKYLSDCKDYLLELYENDNKDFVDLVHYLQDFINEVTESIERKALTNKLDKIFRKNRNKIKSFSNLINELSNKNFQLDKKKILKDILINKTDNIPKKDIINELIRAFKENRVYFHYDSFNGSYFKFYSKKDVNFKRTIITDATATPEIYKYFFPNVKYMGFNIKHQNIFYKLICDKTYTASNINISEIVEKIKDIAQYDYTLLIVPYEIELKLRGLLPENIMIIHYNSSENKGTNDYAHCKKVIAFPPKVNYDEIINMGLCLDPTITEDKDHYRTLKTGYINSNNQEHLFNVRLFKNKLLNELLILNREADIVQGLFRIKRNTEDRKEFYVFGNICLKQFGLIPDEIVYENSKNKTNQIRKEKDFDLLKSHLKSSINNLGFFSSLVTDFNYSDQAQTIVNIEKSETCYIKCNPESNRLVSNNNTFDPISISKETKIKYLKMLVSNSEFISLSLPLLNNSKHKIYCLPGEEDQAIIKAKEYFKDILLSEILKKEYQNKALDDTLSIDSINTPSDNLEPENRLLNDNLNDNINSKDRQEDRKENIISEVGPTYEDYLKNNKDYLELFFNNFIDHKVSVSELINDSDYDLLSEIHKNQDSYRIEYLLNYLSDNLIDFNNRIAQKIELNKIDIEAENIHPVKARYDKYVKDNQSMLAENIKELIEDIIKQDRLIDNNLLDNFTRLAVDVLEIDPDMSFYHQYIVIHLSENIDKYNEYINKKQVERDNTIVINDFIHKEQNYIKKHKFILDKKVNDYVKMLINKKRIIDKRLIFELKNWYSSSSKNSDNFYYRKYLYSEIKRSYAKYNNMILAYNNKRVRC